CLQYSQRINENTSEKRSIAGRRLAQHRSHTFCLIVAGLECMLFPFHAILGIFTFILLLQPEGRALFGATTSEEASKPES
ncbi:MAG: hypothetical protein P1U85_23220, partial [Verrucomicrobiales bacterium]|nr:hypothetical protein [Verrucomicrobiales bacterium]